MQYNDISYGGDSVADNMTKEERGKQMALVKNKNTKPEVELKHLFWNLGYHYRHANWNKLPGKPDLVFVKRKKAVFLHGCFWHRHPGCPNTRLPKSNIEFWENKLSKNVLHDELVYAELQKLGWSYLIIWECEMKKSNRALLENRIHLFMDGEVV